MAIRFAESSLRELRIHLCQTSKESAGVRDFITSHYVTIKKSNPTFPILIRECQGVQPRVWARYAKGCETCFSLCDMNKDQILALLKGLNRK